MDIEDTRNEKVLLIICSYVIGFVTAYIAFGLTHNSFDKQAVNVTPVEAEIYDRKFADTQQPITTNVYENQEGLVVDDGQARIIAARTLVKPEGPTDRIFPVYNLSPSGEFVYYCVQERLDPVCTPYVFEILTGKTNQLVVSGDHVSLSNRDAELEWTSGNLLQGFGIVSSMSDAPWVIALN